MHKISVEEIYDPNAKSGLIPNTLNDIIVGNKVFFMLKMCEFKDVELSIVNKTKRSNNIDADFNIISFRQLKIKDDLFLYLTFKLIFDL